MPLPKKNNPIVQNDEVCCGGASHNCYTCRVCSASYQGCKSCLKCITCQICLTKQCPCCIKGSTKKIANDLKYNKIGDDFEEDN